MTGGEDSVRETAMIDRLLIVSIIALLASLVLGSIGGGFPAVVITLNTIATVAMIMIIALQMRRRRRRRRL